MALQHLRARFPDANETELWEGMPRYEDIGIRENDELYFVADEGANITGDSSTLPESSDLIIGGNHSPNSLARDLSEVDDFLAISTTNVAALAAQERMLRTTLDDTDLGADVAGGGGANTEFEGVARSGGDVAGQHPGGEEGRVDIPLGDEADDN
ncbi:hypothetical protein Dimus_003514 [Dionaea muscipula]